MALRMCVAAVVSVSLGGAARKASNPHSKKGMLPDWFGKPTEPAVQYLRVPDHDTLDQVPDCNFYKAEDLGRRVSDSCCDLSAWPAELNAAQTPPEARTKPGDDSGKAYKCWVVRRVPPNNATFTRNYFGCVDGIITAWEGCAPAGTSMGHGYPMDEATAQAESLDGTPESCGCTADEPPAVYRGPGCFVAFTSSIAGVGNDRTANFVKVTGTCD